MIGLVRLIILLTFFKFYLVYTFNLEVVQPISHQKTTKTFPRNLNIVLGDKKRLFLLTLQKAHMDLKTCQQYFGTVNNENKSSVNISLCNGHYIQGHFKFKNYEYNIYKQSIGRSKTRRSAQVKLMNFHHMRIPRKLSGARQRRLGNYAEASEVGISHGVKYLELYLVNDNSIYRYFDKNITYIKERSEKIARLLDDKFRYLGMRIVLVGTEIWRERDLFEVTESSHATLLKFMRYRKEAINKRVANDNAQFITKTIFDNGEVAGRAPIATICSEKYSAGVSHDSHSNPVMVANIIAHEMGHNLGIDHDGDDNKCKCYNHPKQRCIMNKVIDPNVGRFSECSVHNFYRHMEEGHGFCLFDLPSYLKKPSVCGNGIIEDDEECDCGDRENCAKFGYCCDMITCQLFKNATCASGECCQKCKPQSASTICREKHGECDLPEFCDGFQSTCPANVYLQDTTTCAFGKGYCISGLCLTHSHQCKDLFSNYSAISADGYCYKEYNKQGTNSGHCGKTTIGGYIPCSKKNTYCGKLHCETGNDFKNATVEINKIKWHETGEIKKCVTYIPLKSKNEDLALVQDGTRCGHNNICVNHSCIDVSLYRQRRKHKECPDNCSRNGVCNNKGHCHCFPGWAPPNCFFYDQLAGGGSIDSGPATARVMRMGLHVGSNRRENSIPTWFLIGAILISIGIVVLAIWAPQFLLKKTKRNLNNKIYLMNLAEGKKEELKPLIAGEVVQEFE